MSNPLSMTDRTTDTDELFKQAIALHSKGAVGRAELLYRDVLKLQRNHPDALHMLGVVAYQRGDAEKGIATVKRALAARPEFLDALNNLAGMYLDSKDPASALETATRALSIQGDSWLALRNKAKAQVGLRQFEDANATFEYMAALQPEYGEILRDWAGVLLSLGRYNDAESMFGRLLKNDPGNFDFRCFLAQTIKGQGRFAEALAMLDGILEESPDYVPALVHAGDTAQALGDNVTAIAYFRRAIALQPDHAEAHFNLGVSLLTQGQYREGWEEYAWRFRMEAYADFNPPANAPIWSGEPLAGKSILIYAEQGLGDTIQFVRYAPLLKSAGAEVHCQCSPLVRDLLATVDGIDLMYTFLQAPPDVDYQISMMELPRLFATDASTVPFQDGYMKAPKGSFVKPAEPAVGLVWQGNKAHTNDAYRSVPLARFDDLLGLQGIRFYSLQVGDGAGQIATLGWQNRIVDLSSELESFTDTADVISKLDLVISVDTSVAHLSGALGVPVWVLLAQLSDWRWGRTATSSCWYSSMRLYRQKRLGVWDDVFADIGAALPVFLHS
jgi:tetratricopeptide (TPR) repeat protein